MDFAVRFIGTAGADPAVVREGTKWPGVQNSPCWMDSAGISRGMPRAIGVPRMKRDQGLVRGAKDHQAICTACLWRPPALIGVTILHAHHIVPLSAGGTDSPSNLVLLCPTCHALAHRTGRLTGVGQRDWSGPRTETALLARLIPMVSGKIRPEDEADVPASLESRWTAKRDRALDRFLDKDASETERRDAAWLAAIYQVQLRVFERSARRQRSADILAQHDTFAKAVRRKTA